MYIRLLQMGMLQIDTGSIHQSTERLSYQITSTYKCYHLSLYMSALNICCHGFFTNKALDKRQHNRAVNIQTEFVRFQCFTSFSLLIECSMAYRLKTVFHFSFYRSILHKIHNCWHAWQ